jgi:hypothetical protein
MIKSPKPAAKSRTPTDRRGGRYAQGTLGFRFWNSASCFIALLFSTSLAFAQSQRGTLISAEAIRVSPGADSAKLAEVGRGYDLAVLDHNSEWTQVEAIMAQPLQQESDDEEEQDVKTITGWVRSKAVVSTATPDGDKIIFGEAASAEDQAARRIGQKDAAQDAMRLYYRVYDMFPNSPLAAEGLFRAADDRWQIDRQDVLTRPSAREREAYMRGQINDGGMRLVIKKYPGTRWADLAAFRLIDNKLCGDWQAASKCPEKESDIYEKYVKEHPQSPAAAEALYDAAWRQAALIDIYKTEANRKKSDQAKSRALDLTQKIVSQYPQSDWGYRAQTLMFYVQQGVPTFGETGD